MDTIRRTPSAHEQSMWPDTLPATIGVPVSFTWHVPGDLDLSGTDLTVLGTVQLPPVPSVSVDAATDTSAGVVELATQAEVNAGTDAVRAVTPATLAGWTGGGGGEGAFDDANIVLSDTRDEFSNVPFEIQLTLGGSPISTPALAIVWTVLNGVPFSGGEGIITDDSVSFSVLDTGNNYRAMLVHYPGAAITGKIANTGNGGGTYRVAVALPSGGIALSNAVTFEEPPPP